MTSNCANFPDETTAGLNFQASAVFAGYLSEFWTFKLHLRGPGQIDLDAVDDAFSADAATTAGWAPGTYWYSVRAAGAGGVHEVAKGQLAVLPDLAAASAGFDGRTDNERGLDAINAVLGKRATQDQQKYTINNRELWRTPIADLIKLQAFYKAAVQREKRLKSGRSTFGRTIQVMFK